MFTTKIFAQWKEQDASLSAIVFHNLTGHTVKKGVQVLMLWVIEPKKALLGVKL